jgi:hypothetical protein
MEHRVVGATPGDGWIMVGAWRDTEGQVQMDQSRVVNFIVKEEIDEDGKAYADTTPQVVNDGDWVGETEYVEVALIHPSEDNSWVTQQLAEERVLAHEQDLERRRLARLEQKRSG